MTDSDEKLADGVPESAREAALPVQIATNSNSPFEDGREPQQGIALCLSGGGYRAMLFHLGSLWRLNEAGLLHRLDRVSSVSGGSIVAAQLGLQWDNLDFNDDADGRRVAAKYVDRVVGPVRVLASTNVDVAAALGGIFGPGNVGDRIVGAYRKRLYGHATLQDLPDSPRFVINATNVGSGALWRFMKPYMRDYRVGEVKNPDVELAVAVAASSAFPPFLSPVVLDLDPSDFEPDTGTDLQHEPFTTQVVLTDGGVYDNLGLETAWKRYRTVLVSDGGGKVESEPNPKFDWPRHTAQVLTWTDNQVRSLRKRQLLTSYKLQMRDGAYWGIRSHISDFQVNGALPCPDDATRELALTPTRLKALEARHQERLINWGYAVCDAALRRHVDPKLSAPADFPYPDSPIA